MAAGLRATAGARADEIELAMNIFVVGDEVPPWVQGFIGADAEALIAADSLTMLRGTSTRWSTSCSGAATRSARAHRRERRVLRAARAGGGAPHRVVSEERRHSNVRARRDRAVRRTDRPGQHVRPG